MLNQFCSLDLFCAMASKEKLGISFLWNEFIPEKEEARNFNFLLNSTRARVATFNPDDLKKFLGYHEGIEFGSRKSKTIELAFIFLTKVVFHF